MIAALTGWRRFVPAGARRRLRPVRQAFVDWRRSRPPKLGDLRRVTPIDPNWGFERGTPIDRVYVGRFVGSHASDIRVACSRSRRPTTRRASARESRSIDILMATEGNPQATIVGDLANAPQIRDDLFDCAIVTQTLQFVYDVRAALATLHRILRPGGILLATVPGSRGSRRSRTRSSASGGTTRAARRGGSRRRRSARGTSRS